MSESNIAGGRELDAMLQTLPTNLEKNIMRAALRAGAAVFREEARGNLQRNGSVVSGLLAKGVRITSKAQRGRVSASVKIGGKHAYVAKWVEYGTAAHHIMPKNKRALAFGGGDFAAGVMHSGAHDKPFLRPAFDGRSDEAIAAVAEKVRERLTAEGLTTPAPEVS